MPYFAFCKVKHKDRAFSKLGHGGKSNAEHIGNTAAKIQSYTACLHIISAVKSCVSVVENSRQVGRVYANSRVGNAENLSVGVGLHIN